MGAAACRTRDGSDARLATTPGAPAWMRTTAPACSQRRGTTRKSSVRRALARLSAPMLLQPRACKGGRGTRQANPKAAYFIHCMYAESVSVTRNSATHVATLAA